MPNQGDWTGVVEPGIPEGTNAGLLSSSGTPLTTDTGMSASSGTGGIMGRVSDVVDSGKSMVAGKLHDLGDRLEHTGRGLESGNMLVRPVGRVLDSTGEALESGGRYLRTTDIDVIGDDIVGGIRTRPLLSAGIALGCGMLLGRMFSSSDDSGEEPRRMHDESHDHHGHDSEREEEEEEHDSDRSSFRETLMGKMSELVAGGIASFAARQVRDRIAGR